MLDFLYKWKVFYGKKCYPYNHHPRKIEYKKGDCPVAERLHRDELIITMWTHGALKKKEVNDIVKAIEKVADNFNKLRDV